MEEEMQIKDFRIALKDMEPMVRDPKFLWNGRKIPNFSLLPREAWANWLLCVVFQEIYGPNSITFKEDALGDGILVDKEKGIFMPTEHVSALNIPLKKNNTMGEKAIIEAIDKKIEKGPEYAKGKILVVFFDGIGKWYRNKVREGINGRHNFDSIFGIGLLTPDYSYSVTHFLEDRSISFKIQINSDFTNWSVAPIR